MGWAGTSPSCRYHHQGSVHLEETEEIHGYISIKNQRNNFQSSCHCFRQFRFTSPLCAKGQNQRTMQLKPKVLLPFLSVLGRKGDRGRREQRRGCVTSVVCSRSIFHTDDAHGSSPLQRFRKGAMPWSSYGSHLHRSPLKLQVIFPLLNWKFQQGLSSQRRFTPYPAPLGQQLCTALVKVTALGTNSSTEFLVCYKQSIYV